MCHDICITVWRIWKNMIQSLKPYSLSLITLPTKERSELAIFAVRLKDSLISPQCSESHGPSTQSAHGGWPSPQLVLAQENIHSFTARKKVGARVISSYSPQPIRRSSWKRAASTFTQNDLAGGGFHRGEEDRTSHVLAVEVS
jgi:hypothetical protein